IGVVPDESQPSLLEIGRSHGTTNVQVLLYSARRNSDPQFQLQFVGDAFLWQTRSSGRLRFPAPEQPESFAMPTDECIRLDIHQRTAPREHATQRRHHPTGGIVGSSWFDFALLEQRQLFAKEEVLRSQSATGMRRKESQADQIN